MEEVSEWTPVFDPKYNRVYYYNKRTLVSTWNCPPDLINRFPQYELISSRHAATSLQTQTQTEPFEPEEDVWLECQDSRYNRPYYYNLRSRRSSWTLPTSGHSQIIRKPKRQLTYLPKGTAVRVKLVRSNPLLNGMLGTVVSDGSDRVKILVAGKVLSFCPDNLEVVDKDELQELQKKEKIQVWAKGLQEEDSDVASTDASSIASRLPEVEGDLSDAEDEERDGEDDSEEEGHGDASRRGDVEKIEKNQDSGGKLGPEEEIAEGLNGNREGEGKEEEKEEKKEKGKGKEEVVEEDENRPFFSDRSRLAKLFGTVQRATSSNQFFMAGVDEEAATKMLESATKGEMMEQPEQEKEPESGGEKDKLQQALDEEKKFAMLKRLNVDTEDIIQRIGAMKGDAEFQQNEKFASLMQTMELLKNPDQLEAGGADSALGEKGTVNADAKSVSDAESEQEYPQSDESVTLSQS